MNTITLTKRTRVDFPFRHDETFLVRDGDGKGVELWRHSYGPRKSNTDEKHETHDFVIDILEPAWAKLI